MASNHTEKYQLYQWAPEDPVLREDFNENNRRIEAAFTTFRSEVLGAELALKLFDKITDDIDALTARVEALEKK